MRNTAQRIQTSNFKGIMGKTFLTVVGVLSGVPSGVLRRVSNLSLIPAHSRGVIPAHSHGGHRSGFGALVPVTYKGIRSDFQTVAPVWPDPNCCGPSGNKPADGR